MISGSEKKSPYLHSFRATRALRLSLLMLLLLATSCGREHGAGQPKAPEAQPEAPAAAPRNQPIPSKPNPVQLTPSRPRPMTIENDRASVKALDNAASADPKAANRPRHRTGEM